MNLKGAKEPIINSKEESGTILFLVAGLILDKVEIKKKN